MANVQNSKQYDLEDRTLRFAKQIIYCSQQLPKNIVNNNLVDQCIRSGTSIGANYREANETQTKKDFAFRIRICRKEAKETVYWLYLLTDANPTMQTVIGPLSQEANELVKIFAAIAKKSQ